MPIRFVIRGETIQLDQLLKATGLARSGGSAKAEIATGVVKVDGAVELRKRAKLHAGQVVEYEGETIALEASPAGAEAVSKPVRKADRPARAPAPKAKSAPGRPPRSGTDPAPRKAAGPDARSGALWPRAKGGPTGRNGETQFPSRPSSRRRG